MNAKTHKAKGIIKYLIPVLILGFLLPVVVFMYYPMVNMEVNNLKVGIVNLDTGAEFEQGSVNVGEKIIKSITKSSNKSDTKSPITWKVYGSKDSASKALNEGRVYAYLVIPKDYSSNQTSTLNALNNLGTALGSASDGVGKLSTGVSKIGSNMNKLPTAFNKLSTATGSLATAANKLSTVSSTMSYEASNITSSVEAITNSQQDIVSSSTNANSALDKLKEDIANNADSETINSDIEDIQDYLNGVKTATSNNTDNLKVITQNATMISGQSVGVKQGLNGIETANINMSSNFKTMSNKMTNIGPGVNKLNTALGTLGTGLSTMSDNLDSKVSDAVDTMNDDSSDSESAESNSGTPLKFYIDQRSNILISTNLGTAINKVSANSGVSIETTYVHPLADGMNSMYFLMSFILMSMFATMIPSIITGTMTTRKGYMTVGSRLKTIAGQLFTCLLAAACIGLLVPHIISWMCNVDKLDYTSCSICVGIFSLGMLLLTVGLFDLAGRLGMVVPIITMFCGMAVANLPYEFLPAFWQKYIYPWEPLRLLADEIREICYRNGNWQNDFTHALLIMSVVGIIFMLLSLLKSIKKSKNLTIDYSEEDIENAVLQQTREDS